MFWLYFDVEVTKLQGQLRVGLDDLNRLHFTDELKNSESQILKACQRLTTTAEVERK
jgi:hypothetical protein